MIKYFDQTLGQIPKFGEFFRDVLHSRCRSSSKMSNIFGCTCPNHSEVGAIDNPDQCKQTFDTYYPSEVSENIFTDKISMDHPQKMYSFCVLKAFKIYKQFYLL